ncbi:MAG: prepilin-type N-terminal cleavage/methylation domain-containing protein [Pirellulaceae bacterium]
MSPRHSLFARRRRRGLTLVEIMVSAAISLIVILALVQLFKHSGDIVSEGRATIEMAGQVRRAAQQVREDLAGLTVPTTPWPTDAAADGYFEYFEGTEWDGFTVLAGDTDPNNDVYGDLDDAIMFTARSDERPFVGRYLGNTIESNLAEIIIFPFGPSGQEKRLYRRVLLIRPDLAGGGFLNLDAGNVASGASLASLAAFYNLNDVSVRIDRADGANGYRLRANSLSDLTKRENRFLHVVYPLNTNSFPFPFNQTYLGSMLQTGLFAGNDVILDHVTSFDVKAYDPTALIRQDATSSRALEPSDPGYAISAGASPAIPPIGQGAYVDLGYNRYTVGSSRFSGGPHVKSQLFPASYAGYTFCTWSSHYERDGFNQDNDAITDEATDGLDNDGVAGVDDGGELETTPPYPFPLRSLQIKIRIMDSVTQNVRQATIQNDFFDE